DKLCTAAVPIPNPSGHNHRVKTSPRGCGSARLRRSPSTAPPVGGRWPTPPRKRCPPTATPLAASSQTLLRAGSVRAAVARERLPDGESDSAAKSALAKTQPPSACHTPAAEWDDKKAKSKSRSDPSWPPRHA